MVKKDEELKKNQRPAVKVLHYDLDDHIENTPSFQRKLPRVDIDKLEQELVKP